MDNLELYNRVRNVPDEAKKPINAGRLKGMTDINPMWRIKKLTEEFGVCGTGWKTEIKDIRVDSCGNEVIVTMFVNLFFKDGDAWSEPILGVGGSKLVSSEKNGLFNDDDAFKKAYTDALSVCCKALGIGADVYFDKDVTKYTKEDENEPNQVQKKKTNFQIINDMLGNYGYSADDVKDYLARTFGKSIKVNDLEDGQFKMLCQAIMQGDL